MDIVRWFRRVKNNQHGGRLSPVNEKWAVMVCSLLRDGGKWQAVDPDNHAVTFEVVNKVLVCTVPIECTGCVIMHLRLDDPLLFDNLNEAFIL